MISSNCELLYTRWANTSECKEITCFCYHARGAHSCGAALSQNMYGISPRVSKQYPFRFMTSAAKYQTDRKHRPNKLLHEVMTKEAKIAI